MLASTKARVQSLLWQSPGVLQNAFYSAFHTLVNAFRPDAASETDDGTATACRLLSEWEAERKPRSAVTDLVRLQTLVMVVMAVDCLSMAAAKNQAGGPSKSEILGRAVGLGLSMRLYLREVDSEPGPDFDPNSDDNVALRAWWVLVDKAIIPKHERHGRANGMPSIQHDQHPPRAERDIVVRVGVKVRAGL